jgi:hypothetical protein
VGEGDVGEEGEEEVTTMTPGVRSKRRGWTTIDGSRPSMGGSCASHEDVTSAPILHCGARGDVRLGERGNASVGETFCHC